MAGLLLAVGIAAALWLAVDGLDPCGAADRSTGAGHLVANLLRLKAEPDDFITITEPETADHMVI